MSWSLWKVFRSKQQTEEAEQVRQLRGELAHAVVAVDRRTAEVRGIMTRALQRREDYGRETDR